MSLHDDLTRARWRKASRSSASGSDCVEIAQVAGLVAIRDSKAPDGPTVVIDRKTWRALTNRAHQGELEL
ncbi:DUF397 domain-containing protein [Actinomadura chokoriensis]|uniref:DUF397 domain-containing protein n=1 Tax=Actinomadura chokoriensis TaxID=454156 RepID=A0ABV4QUF3_9ACTN